MQLRALKSTSANSRNSRLPRAVLAILAGSIASMAVARSANAAVWTGTTGGTWVTTGKWEGGGVGGSPAPATTDSSIVSFPANTPANTRINVTVDSGRNVGGFSFPASGANFGNYLFVGGQLVFSAGASVSVTGSKSTASFVVPITLLGDASFSTSRSLGIGGGGTITGSAGAGVTNTISVSSSGSGGVHFGAISDGSGGGKLALTSSGSADLTSASSYSGDTTINGGSLSVEQGSAIYSDGDNFLSPNSAIYLNNGTLDLSASSTQTVPSVHLTGTNTIALGLRNGYTQTLNSILSGPGGILISGTSSSAATFVSPGLNTFTGDVNISHGTFSVNALADPATAQPLGQGANPVTLSNTGR